MALTTVAKIPPYPVRRLEALECVTQIPQGTLSSVQHAFALNDRNIQAAQVRLLDLRNKVQLWSSSLKENLVPRVDACGWDYLVKFGALGVLATAKTTLAVCKFTRDVADQISPWRCAPAPVGNKRQADPLEPGSEAMPQARLALSQPSLAAPAPMTPMPMGHTAALNEEKPPGLRRVIKVTVTSPVSTPLQLNVSLAIN